MHLTTDDEWEAMSPECREEIQEGREIIKNGPTIHAHYHPGFECPDCGRKLFGINIGGKSSPPKPKDTGMCLHCGSWLTVTDDLKLRWATVEEVNSVPEEAKEITIAAHHKLNKRN